MSPKPVVSVAGRSLALCLLLAACLLVSLSLGGCTRLQSELKGNRLDQRLRVSKQCTLMGEKDASDVCIGARQALIGKAKVTPGDRLALTCFDHLHARKIEEARKAFSKGLTTEATNPYVISCGKEITRFNKK